MCEQSCGACEYFTSDEEVVPGGGWCWWASDRKNHLPTCYNEWKKATYRGWGEDCRCFSKITSQQS